MNFRGIILIVFCLFCTGLFGLDALKISSWPTTNATVTAIKVTCEVKAEKNYILSKTTSTATVPCDQVEMFRVLHPDQDWRVTTQYLATMRVVRDGVATMATLLMHEVDGRKPQIGDVRQVVQDPDFPARIREVGGLPGEIGMAAVTGIGALLLAWVTFRKRRTPRQQFTAATQAAAAHAYNVRKEAARGFGRR